MTDDKTTDSPESDEIEIVAPEEITDGVDDTATPVSLRPKKRSSDVAKKGSATPKQKNARDEAVKRTSPSQFLREVVEELRKVVWLNRSQLWQYFIVVLVFVLFIILFVSLLDGVFAWVLLRLFG
ncbi:MAG: preprotein translocase subunit SecE [Propionibacteriaceae bacterium]